MMAIQPPPDDPRKRAYTSLKDLGLQRQAAAAQDPTFTPLAMQGILRQQGLMPPMRKGGIAPDQYRSPLGAAAVSRTTAKVKRLKQPVYDTYSGWKNELGGVAVGGLSLLAKPLSIMASTAKETLDLFQGEGFSPQDWWEQADLLGDDFYTFGRLLDDEDWLQDRGSLFQLTMPVGWLGNVFGKDWDDWHWDVTPSFLVAAPFDILGDPLAWMTLGLGKFGQIAHAVKAVGTRGISKKVLDRSLKSSLDDAFWRTGFVADKATLDSLPKIADQLLDGAGWAIGKSDEVAKQGLWRQSRQEISDHINKYLSGQLEETTGFAGFVQNGEKISVKLGSGTIDDIAELVATQVGVMSTGVARGLSTDGAQRIARLMQEFGLDDMFRSAAEFGGIAQFAGKTHRPLFAKGADMTRRGNRVQRQLGLKVPMTGYMGRSTVNKAIANLNRHVDDLDGLLSRVGDLQVPELTKPMGLVLVSGSSKWLDTTIRAIPASLQWLVADKMGIVARGATRGLLGGKGGEVLLKGQVTEAIPALKGKKGFQYPWRAGAVDETAQKKAVEILQRRSLKDIVRDKSLDPFLRIGAKETLRAFGRGNAVWRKAEAVLGRHAIIALKRLDDIGVAAGRKSMDPEWGEMLFRAGSLAGSPEAAVQRALIGDEAWEIMMEIFPSMKALSEDMAGMAFIKERPWYMPHQLDADAARYVEGKSNGRIRFDPAGFEKKRLYVQPSEVEDAVKRYATAQGEKKPWGQLSQKEQEAWRAAHAKQPKAETSFFMEEELFDVGTLMPDGLPAGDIPEQILNIMNRHGIDHGLFNRNFFEVLPTYTQTLAKRTGEVHVEQILRSKGVLSDRWIAGVQLPPVEVMNAARTLRVKLVRANKARKELLDRIKEAANDERATGLYKGAEVKAAVKVEEAATREAVAAQAVADEMNAALILKQEEFVVATSQLEAVEARIAQINEEIGLRWPRGLEGERLKMPRKEATRKFNEVKRLLAEKHSLEDQIRRLEFGDPTAVATLDTGTVYGGLWEEARTAVAAKVFLEKVLITTFNDIETARKFAVWYAQQWDETIKASVGVQGQLFPTAEGARGGSDVVDAMRKAGLTFETTAADGTVVRVSAEEGSKALDLIGQALDDQGIGQWLAYDNLDEFMPSGAQYRGGSAIVMRALDDVNGLVAEKIGKLDALLVKYTREVPDLLPTVYMAVPDDVRDMNAGLQSWLEDEIKKVITSGQDQSEYLVDLMTSLAEVRQTIAAADELQPLLNRWGVPHPEAVEDATKVIMRAFQATDRAAAIATQEFDDAARLHLAIHGPKLFEQINDSTDMGRMVSIYKRALADRHDQIVAELAKNPAAQVLMDVGNQVTETAATMGLPDFVFYQQFQRRLKDALENANTPNLLRPSLEDLNVDLRRNVQVVEGPNGERYVVRRFTSQEAMNVAVVANAVYRELGVPVRPTWAAGKSGRSYWMISEESGGVVPVSVEDLVGSKVVFNPATGLPAIVPLDQPTVGGLAGTAFAAKFGEGFAADILLGNADALGAKGANVGLAADGSVVRLQTHEVLDAGSLVEATGDHLTAKREILLGRIRIAEDQQAIASSAGQSLEAERLGSVVAQRRDEVRLIDQELSTRLRTRGPQIIRHMGEEGTGGTFDGLWTNYIKEDGGTVTSSVKTELRARRSIDNWAATEVERQSVDLGEYPEAVADLMRAMDYARTLPRILAEGGVDDRMAQIIEIHRLVTQHDPSAPRGLRRVEVSFDVGASGVRATPADSVPLVFERLVEHGYPLHEASSTYARDVDEFIKQFLDVHPFKDGNGRVASVLRNHLLPMDEGGLAHQLLPDYYGNDPWIQKLEANQNVEIEVSKGLGVTLWDTAVADGGMTEKVKDAIIEAMGIDSAVARDRKLMYVSWGLSEEALGELPELMTHGIARSADGVAAWQVGDINFIDDMVRDGSIPADVIADNHPFWSNPEIVEAVRGNPRGKRSITADDFRTQYEEWKLQGDQENRFADMSTEDYERSLNVEADVDERGIDPDNLWDDMGDEYFTGAGDDLYDMVDDPLDREVIEAADLAIDEGVDVGSVLDPTRTLRKATGTEKMDNARLVLNGLKVLKKMITEIDDEGITIFATVSAHDDDLAVTLRKWYAKHGFEQIEKVSSGGIWYIVRPAKRQPPMGRAPLDFRAYIGPESEMGGSANLMHGWDEMIQSHNGSMVDRVRTQVEGILAVRERFGGWHALVKSAVPDGTDDVAIKNIANTLERRTSELADRFGLNYREGHELWSSSAESATFSKGELRVLQREQVGLKGTEAATIQPSAVAGRVGVVAPEGSEYLPWIDGNAIDTTLVPSDQLSLFEHGRIRSADLGEGQGLRIDIGSGRRIKVYGIQGDQAVERANHHLLEIGDPSRSFDSSVTGAMDDLIEEMPSPYGHEEPFSAVSEQGRLASETAEMTLDILDRAGDDLLDELIGFVENVSPRNVAKMEKARETLQFYEDLLARKERYLKEHGMERPPNFPEPPADGHRRARHRLVPPEEYQHYVHLDEILSEIEKQKVLIENLGNVAPAAWIRQARTIMATPQLASMFPAASLEQQRGLFREVLEFVAWRNDHYSPQLVKRDIASLHDMIATYFAYRNPALNPHSYAWHVAKAEQSAGKYSNNFMKNVHIRYMEHQEGIATGVWHDRMSGLDVGQPYVVTEGEIQVSVSRASGRTAKEFGLEAIPYDQQVVIGWDALGPHVGTPAQNAARYRKGLQMVARVADELNAEGFYVFATVDSIPQEGTNLQKAYKRRGFIRSDIDIPLDDEFSAYHILQSEFEPDDLDFWVSLNDGDIHWDTMTGAERQRWIALQDRAAELVGPEGLYPTAHGLDDVVMVDEMIPIVRGPKGQTLKEMREGPTIVLRPHLARTPEESVIGRLWTQYQLSLAGDGYVGTARLRGQRNPITHYPDDPSKGPVYGLGRMADVDQLTDEGVNTIIDDLAAASQTPSPVVAAQNAGMKYHVEVRLTNPLGAKIVPPELTPASLLDPEQAALRLDQQATELVPPEQFQKAFREEAIEAISTDYGVAALERRRALLDNPLEEAVANQQKVTDDLFLMEQEWSETLENLALLERARGDSVVVRQMAQHAAGRHGRLIRALAKLQTLDPQFKFKKGGVGAVSDAYADLESAIMQIGMADLEEAKMMLNVLNDDFDNALEILRDASGGMGALRNLPEAEIIFEQSFQSGMRPVGTGSQGPAALVDSIVLADAYNARGGVRGFFRYYDKTHNLWKGYAVLSPGFWSRNFMGGLFMNFLHGVSHDSYGRFLSALRYLRAEQALARGEITAAQSRKLQAGMGKRAADIEIVRQLDRGGLFGAGQAGVEFISHSGPRKGTVVIGGRVINLNSANPFSSQFLPLRGGLNMNVGVETMLRGSMGFDVMAKGGMIDEAADMIFKYHFDYDDLSWFERKVIKRVVPFYTWTRKSLPLIMEQFVVQPIKFQRYRQAMDAIGSAEKDRSDFGVVPDWMVRQGALPLGAKFGDEHMWMIPDLPVKSFYEIVNAPLRDDLTPMGRVAEVGEALSSMVSPLIKAPVEVYMKRNIWKGYNFEGRFEYVPRVFSNVPFLMEALEGVGVARKAGNGEWVMRDNYLHGIAQLLPTFSQARRLFPDEERYQKRLLSSWMSFAFGLGLRTNTQWEQEQELRGRYYEERDKQRDLRDVQNVRAGAR